MNSRLRVWLFIILTMIVFLSLAYSFYSGASSLVGWPELVLGVILLFVGVGDQITKMVVSPSQISIEQSVEGQVQQFADDNERINRFVTQDNSNVNITKIVDETLEHPRDTWSRLLIIRITLRRLLRMLCDTAKIPYHDTTSITHMSTELQKTRMIDKELANQIETIRNATFNVEWGAGPPASIDDIKFTLKQYSEVFAALKQRAKEISVSRFTSRSSF